MTFEEIEGTIYCRFEESMNTSVCTGTGVLLAEHIDAALERTPDINVVFDLAGTRYIASSFLRLCVSYRKKLGKKHFRVENVCEDIRSVFNITGLSDMLVDPQ